MGMIPEWLAWIPGFEDIRRRLTSPKTLGGWLVLMAVILWAVVDAGGNLATLWNAVQIVRPHVETSVAVLASHTTAVQFGLIFVGLLWIALGARATTSQQTRGRLSKKPAAQNTAATAATYPTAAEISERLKRLETLRLLQEVGTHMLRNRPQSDDVNRREENLDWWEARVIETTVGCGISTDTVGRFKVLGDVPDPGGIIGRIVGKIRSLDRIIEEARAAVDKDFNSLTEALRSFGGIVLKSVDDPDHERKVVRIKALTQPQMTPEADRLFHAIKAEFRCLGYSVIGWPGEPE